jgi:hypothetical protein
LVTIRVTAVAVAVAVTVRPSPIAVTVTDAVGEPEPQAAVVANTSASAGKAQEDRLNRLNAFLPPTPWRSQPQPVDQGRKAQEHISALCTSASPAVPICKWTSNRRVHFDVRQLIVADTRSHFHLLRRAGRAVNLITLVCERARE